MQDMLRSVIRSELEASSEPCIPEASTVVHTNVACDGCDINPIVGIRYKCSECPNFDYCEACEASHLHDHPFIKIRDPATYRSQAPGQVVEIDIDVKDLPGLVNGGMQALHDKIAGTLVPHCELIDFGDITGTVAPGSTQEVNWAFRNAGPAAIPASRVTMVSDGAHDWKGSIIEETAPDAIFSVWAQFIAPAVEGNYLLSWQLETTAGVKFGPQLDVEFTIEEVIYVPEEHKESVEILKEMGFTVREAVEKMQQAGGDIGLAISMMPK